MNLNDKKINNYYSSIDPVIIDNLCKDNNIKNLINLSTITDLYIFNKKNQKWKLKPKDKLLKECETIKKKELKTSSSMLSNLAKLNSIDDINNVKTICDNLQCKMNAIEQVIGCIKQLDSSIDLVPIKYDNEKEINNIVSFDELGGKKKNKEQIKIFDDNLKNLDSTPSSSSSDDDFIECYSNC